MKELKFSYEEENDDLFVYLENYKSAGAVELGNFVFDFDGDKNVIAIQIFEASKVLAKVVSKVIELTKIKKIEAEVTNFRNMDAMKMRIITDSGTSEGTVMIPLIKGKSPSLNY